MTSGWSVDPQTLLSNIDTQLESRTVKMEQLHEMRETLMQMCVREDKNISQHLILAMVEVDKALLLHEIEQRKKRIHRESVVKDMEAPSV